MKRIWILATLLSSGITQAAQLNEMQLDGLLTGNTVYLQVPAGGPVLPDGGGHAWHWQSPATWRNPAAQLWHSLE